MLCATCTTETAENRGVDGDDLKGYFDVLEPDPNSIPSCSLFEVRALGGGQHALGYCQVKHLAFTLSEV